MSHQAPLNGSANHAAADSPGELRVSKDSRESKMAGRGSTRAFVGNAVDAIHDVVELVELQAKLLAADTATARHKIILPTVLLLVGCCLLLGTIPVALMSLAEVFVNYIEWPQWLASGAACGCGLLLATTMLLFGWYRMKSGFNEFDNSRKELQRNVAWIKCRLRNQQSSTAASQA